MPRFRKRPVVIDAVQFTGGNLAQIAEFSGYDVAEQCDRFYDSIVIETLEGDMKARPGDWIIKGVKGELYPCRDDIFGVTYEPVEDT